MTQEKTGWKDLPKAQNPLMLRYHRLLDAFAKADDERDFYLDRVEGFLFFVDLDKSQQELEELSQEFKKNGTRYCLVPKMTFYETKKFMEGFVNEKVYDIDTKEKLLDIIQSKEARENFLEFVYDHLTELEKWQQYYHERSRIRIIEWLRNQGIQFVFEEDLDLTKGILEKLKRHLFDAKPPKEVVQAREILFTKAKTYYSSEALNPRPKRGRPPKQAAKVDVEPQVTVDMFTMVPPVVRPFLYLRDITSPSAVTFSARFSSKEELLANLRGSSRVKIDPKLEKLSSRLQSLQVLAEKFSIGSSSQLGAEPRGGEEKLSAASMQPSSEPTEKKRGFFDVIRGVFSSGSSLSESKEEEESYEPGQDKADKSGTDKSGTDKRSSERKGKDKQEPPRKTSSIKTVTPLSSKKKKQREEEDEE